VNKKGLKIMAKRKAKTTTAKTRSKPKAASKPKAKPSAPKEKSTLQKAVTEAGFIIGQLKAHLKNTQITFLKIGALLVDVRDRKRYEVLHHKNIEEFAWVRLKWRPDTERRPKQGPRAPGRCYRADGGTEGQCGGRPARAHLAFAGVNLGKFESERMIQQ
jgi:hypothetical protein